MQYGARHGCVLRADGKGVAGITPLHLAALLPDGGTTAQLLADHCLPGAHAPES